MKTIKIMITMLVLLMLVTGCAAVPDVGEAGQDSSDTDTQAETASPPIDGQYILGELLMLEITTNYALTCNYEFDEEEIVPFEEVFDYFRFDGCYNSLGTAISRDVIEYYDKETLTFSVPRKIADEYLTEKFNVEPTPEAVEYYDAESDCYVFERHLGENYYENRVVAKNYLGQNKYEFTVKRTSAISPEVIEPWYYTFTIMLSENDYKILGVDIETEEHDGYSLLEKGEGYSVYHTGDGLYHFRVDVYGAGGDVIKSIYTRSFMDTVKTSCDGAEVIGVIYSAGTGISTVCATFCNTKTGAVSEEFTYYLDCFGDRVLLGRVDGVVVQHMFDGEKYYKLLDDFSDEIGEGLLDAVDGKFSEDGKSVLVTYRVSGTEDKSVTCDLSKDE